MANQELAEVLVARRPRLVNLGKVWHVLRTWPIIPVFLLSLVVVSGVAAPWIAPHDPDRGITTSRVPIGIYAVRAGPATGPW